MKLFPTWAAHTITFTDGTVDIGITNPTSAPSERGFSFCLHIPYVCEEDPVRGMCLLGLIVDHRASSCTAMFERACTENDEAREHCAQTRAPDLCLPFNYVVVLEEPQLTRTLPYGTCRAEEGVLLSLHLLAQPQHVAVAL